MLISLVLVKLLTPTLTAIGLFALPSLAAWDCFLKSATPYDPAYIGSANNFARSNCNTVGGTFVVAGNAYCHSPAAGNCPAVFLKVYHPILSAPGKPNVTIRAFYECKAV